MRGEMVLALCSDAKSSIVEISSTLLLSARHTLTQTSGRLARSTPPHTQTRRSHGGKPGSWKPRRRKNAPLAHNVLNLSGAHVHAITNLSLCPLHNQTTDLVHMRTHRKPSPARPERAHRSLITLAHRALTIAERGRCGMHYSNSVQSCQTQHSRSACHFRSHALRRWRSGGQP